MAASTRLPHGIKNNRLTVACKWLPGRLKNTYPGTAVSQPFPNGCLAVNSGKIYLAGGTIREKSDKLYECPLISANQSSPLQLTWETDTKLNCWLGARPVQNDNQSYTSHPPEKRFFGISRLEIGCRFFLPLLFCNSDLHSRSLKINSITYSKVPLAFFNPKGILQLTSCNSCKICLSQKLILLILPIPPLLIENISHNLLKRHTRILQSKRHVVSKLL